MIKQIPKKITPDCLIDTLVEIRYNSNISNDLINGVMYNILGTDYQYIPIKSKDIESSDSNIISPELSGGFFTNKIIKIQVSENLIGFNCSKDYIGWSNYYLIIKNVIEKCSFIKNMNRVSIRYISKFDNVSIFDKLDGKVHLNSLHSMKGGILHLENIDKDQYIFINISNDISKKNHLAKNSDDSSPSSYIDINVFEKFSETNDISILFEKLEYAHLKQKETFYSVISPEFINSLNPEY